MSYQPRRVFWALLALVAVLSPGSLWAQGNFVYTNDDQQEVANTVSAFSVARNGTLTPVAGSPFPTGGFGAGGGFYASNRITTAGNFLFASNSKSNDVSVFTIDPITGALTPVAGSPFPTGGTGIAGIALAATPDGLLMAANSDGGSHNITVFNIAADGKLTPIAGSPFPTQSRPDGIKVTPNGKFLAVAEPEVGGVEMFSIASSGALTSLGRFAEGGAGSLAGVDIDCSTSFLYGGEASISTTVDAYNIAPDGSLTPLPGSPFMPGVGSSSNVVLLSPDDKTLFVSNQMSSTITVFSVDSSGSLSLLAGSPFPMKGHVYDPSGMATSQDGTRLYVASSKGNSNALSVFSVATDGTLTEVAKSPFFPGQPPSLLSLTAYPPKSCVPRHATITTLVSSQNPAPLGGTMFFTSTVTNDVGGPVTGIVTFLNGFGRKLGNVPLSDGVAIFPFVFEISGHKQITAVYSGDLYNSPSTSPPLMQDAARIPIRPRMEITSSLNPSHSGQAVTFTAILHPKFGKIPDGELMTFEDLSNRTILGKAALVAGKASLTTSSLTVVRMHVIRATYEGDSTYTLKRKHVNQVVTE
jgi:6-phosphogluconolactonase (cycloisomerase 2 family)